MKCSVVLLSCGFVLCVSQSEAFKILSKLKDLLHPTTSTTTQRTVPILPDYENGNLKPTLDSEWSSEKNNNHSKELNGFDKINKDTHFEITPLTTSSNFGEDSIISKKENIPTITPASNMGLYPEMTRENLTSTTMKYTYNQVPLSSTTEKNPTTQTNKPSNFDDNFEPDTPFEDAIDCSAKATAGNLPGNINNEVRPEVHNVSSGCAGKGNFIQKEIPKPHNNDQAGTIIYPDSPLVNQTEKRDTSLDKGNNSKTEDVESTTFREKKSHGAMRVPVAMDDGRNIIDAPSVPCGPDKKRDDNGRCRPIV